MLEKYKYHIWLHVTVLIFGLTGILGKLITTNSYLLVWYRVGIALGALLLYFFFTKHSLKIERKTLYKILLTGIIIAVHWITFFEAIKQSNVSVALVCFSSGTLFTSLIKPYELIFGVLIMVGLYFIFNFEFQYIVGIVLSLISAALSSWFTVLNGIYIKNTSSKTITFYELLGAFLIISIYLSAQTKFDYSSFLIPIEDLKWLLILGILCTAFAFLMSTEVMKVISPYTVTISVNLEPIYSIILALIIWPESETMTYGFYMGTIIVIATIFLNAMFKKKATL
ncbi:MAG: DMT family transporter [Flavobacteriales bacterium]|nr:DMT family transporter [Flavobacteriales bacterium]